MINLREVARIFIPALMIATHSTEPSPRIDENYPLLPPTTSSEKINENDGFLYETLESSKKPAFPTPIFIRQNIWVIGSSTIENLARDPRDIGILFPGDCYDVFIKGFPGEAVNNMREHLKDGSFSTFKNPDIAIFFDDSNGLRRINPFGENREERELEVRREVDKLFTQNREYYQDVRRAYPNVRIIELLPYLTLDDNPDFIYAHDYFNRNFLKEVAANFSNVTVIDVDSLIADKCPDRELCFADPHHVGPAIRREMMQAVVNIIQ